MILVGSGSLATGAKPADQIRVPLQAVTVGKQTGRFGWWISDESTKAKINAGAVAGGLAAAADPLSDSQSPPYVGHQAITDLKDFVWKPGQRSIAVSNGVVNLAASLSLKGLGSLNHDITVHSAGILGDVREGRLKRDLSSLLARPVTELENKPLYLAGLRAMRLSMLGEID